MIRNDAEHPPPNENKQRCETLEIAPANQMEQAPMRQFHDQPPSVAVALYYSRRFDWAVLPKPEKKFYTRYRVRSATRDPNIIKQWGWAESFGMACGEPSRTDVLDINDAEAFAVAGFDLGALAASTLAATTPSGGLHLFFEFAGLRSRLFPWGGWWSTGHAVVLPPASGRRWLNDLTPQPAPPPELIKLVKQKIKSVDEFPFFPFPPPVVLGDELPKPIYEVLVQAMPLTLVLGRRHQRWAGSILRKLIAHRDRRNTALMRATLDFRPIIAKKLIAEADARSLLVMACSANGYLDKVGIDRVNATISWALRPLEE
jgi:Bifunctional DNA primase/polymerase, N-terminal